jgi:hypothetical protein
MGTCVKFVNSFPFEVTPTVKTGIPCDIIWLAIAVKPSDVAGSIEMQSIAPAASFAWICDSCWLRSVCTGAIEEQFILRIFCPAAQPALYPCWYCWEKSGIPEA